MTTTPCIKYPPLRDYQRLAFQHVLTCLQQGTTRLYVSLPTGTGKSVVLTALAAHLSTHGRVLVLAHLQDLVSQLASSLQRCELDVGVVMQGQRQYTHSVIVATPQSFFASLSSVIEGDEKPIATVFIDEAHHAVQGSLYEQILTLLETAFPHTSLAAIGFTATPYRSDPKSMLSVLPTCAFIREIPEMIQGSWLAPLTWVPLPLDIDLSALQPSTQAGALDYAEHALAETLLHRALMEEVVHQIVPRLQQRPTLVFAASVEHAKQLAMLFCQAGRSAIAISGQTPHAQRERLYADWRAGTIQVVCNCSLLTEGFDFPAIAALVIARPTHSAGLYLQMLGRGMRKAPGKHDCLVIDVMDNHPDLSHQVVLPQILGVKTYQEISTPPDRQASSPASSSEALLKRLMGDRVQTGLSILDPLGASPYRWSSFRRSYFTTVSSGVAAILEPDPSGSGLYHSRLFTMKPGQEPIHQWIEPKDLPLRQHVALVHEVISTRAPTRLGSKDAPWVDQPATEKQRATLKRLYPQHATQIDATPLTKGEASDAITSRQLRKTLSNPPPKDA